MGVRKPWPPGWVGLSRKGPSALIALLFLQAAATGSPALAGVPAEVKTLLVRAAAAAEEGRVSVTWRGSVHNPGGEVVRVPVRLVARDSQWRPVAYLLVPGVEVLPGARAQEEAVFEIEEALWRRIHVQDPQVAEA